LDWHGAPVEDSGVPHFRFASIPFEMYIGGDMTNRFSPSFTFRYWRFTRPMAALAK
jgi:hypothetical protein